MSSDATADAPVLMDADALLFDNDGTLVDSMASVTRCWSRWAREYDVPVEALDRVVLHGRPATEIIADLVPATQVAAARERVLELELADADGSVLLPGTAELVAALPARNWAVVTSASGELASRRLESVGIAPPLVVSSDDIQRGKPDPEPFLLAAERLGVDPARCIVFEDAPVGLAAARAAGMRSIAVTTTHTAQELDADCVTEGLHRVSVETGDRGEFRLSVA